MSKAYGIYAGCSRAPKSPHWIVDPNVAPDAAVSSLVALSRYGSAGELLAWLPIVATVTGHAGLGLCVPWDNTRPITRECSVQALTEWEL